MSRERASRLVCRKHMDTERSVTRVRAGAARAVMGALLLLAANACRETPPLSYTAERVHAADDLVSLMVADSGVVRVLRLVPQPGVRINAQLLPVVEPGITFDSPGRTADSAYFAVPPEARVPTSRAISGTLRASACPEGKKVCLSVALDVKLPSGDHPGR